MKRTRDACAQMLLRKSGNDLIAANATLATGKAMDTVCFHAQQAVEKALKSLLSFHGVKYPFRHDLGELLALASPRFLDLNSDKKPILALTPFAVELRYDEEVLPSKSTAARFVRTAEKIHGLIAKQIRKPSRRK